MYADNHSAENGNGNSHVDGNAVNGTPQSHHNTQANHIALPPIPAIPPQSHSHSPSHASHNNSPSTTSSSSSSNSTTPITMSTSEKPQDGLHNLPPHTYIPLTAFSNSFSPTKQLRNWPTASATASDSHTTYPFTTYDMQHQQHQYPHQQAYHHQGQHQQLHAQHHQQQHNLSNGNANYHHSTPSSLAYTHIHTHAHSPSHQHPAFVTNGYVSSKPSKARVEATSVSTSSDNKENGVHIDNVSREPSVADADPHERRQRPQRAAKQNVDYTFPEVFKDNYKSTKSSPSKSAANDNESPSKSRTLSLLKRHSKMTYGTLILCSMDEFKQNAPRKPMSLRLLKKVVAAGLEEQGQEYRNTLFTNALQQHVESGMIAKDKLNFDIGATWIKMRKREAAEAARLEKLKASSSASATANDTPSAQSNQALIRAAKQAAKQRAVSEQQQKQNEFNDVVRSLRVEYQARRDIYVYHNINIFQPFIDPKILEKLVHEVQQPPSTARLDAQTKKLQITPHQRWDKEAQKKPPPMKVYPPLKNYSKEITQQPSIITATLRPYQIQSLAWFAHLHDFGMAGILADEMGLGKTLQTISMMAWLRENRGMLGPHLVVVPLNVLETWVEEIRRFCPAMKIVRYHGSEKERQRIMEEQMIPEHYDLLVTTYETLVNSEGFFTHRQLYCYVIVDEAHRIKNEDSLAAQALRRVPCFNRLLLTGTPIQNNLVELGSLLSFLYPTYFAAYTQELFKKGFNAMTGQTDSKVLKDAQRLLSVVMVRRLKRDVAPNLPPKTEYLVPCELSGYQNYWYKQFLSIHCDFLEEATADVTKKGDTVLMEEKHAEAGEDDDGGHTHTSSLSASTSSGKQSRNPRSSPTMDDDTQHLLEHMQSTNESDDSWRKLMNLMCRLRQVSNHPYLIRNARPETDVFGENEVVVTSGKMKVLDALLSKLKREGHRVLIFSSFTQMLNLLEEYMQVHEYKYLRLDGSTTRVQRKFEITRYNSDPSFFVYLISTRAGGLGVNLPTADTVIHYDSDWNPQADLQAQDRAHRIGQTKPVTVYRLVTSGTVEERMVARAQKKLFLDARVMNSDGIEKQALEKWTKGDLLSIIKHGAGNVFSSNGIDSESKVDIDAVLKASVMIRHSHSNHNQPPSTTGKFTSSSSSSDTPTSPTGKTTSSSADSDAMIVSNNSATKIKSEAPNDDVNVEVLESVLGHKDMDVNIQELAITAFEGKTLKKREWKDQADMWVEALQAKNAVAEAAGLGDSTMYGGVKRDRTAATVMVGGDAVLKENLYDAFTSDLGRAVIPDSRIIDILYRPFVRHHATCHACKDGGDIVLCTSCPLAYHASCLGMTDKEVQAISTFRCPQHECSACERRASDAGGLLFRCVSCPNAYCEDHLNTHIIEPIFDVPMLSCVGYSKPDNAYYVLCSNECKEHYEKDATLREREIKEVRQKDSPDGITRETQSRIKVLIAGNALHMDDELESQLAAQATAKASTANGGDASSLLTSSSSSLIREPITAAVLTSAQLEEIVKDFMYEVDMRAETPSTIRKQVEEKLGLPPNSLKPRKNELAQLSTKHMSLFYQALENGTHRNLKKEKDSNNTDTTMNGTSEQKSSEASSEDNATLNSSKRKPGRRASQKGKASSSSSACQEPTSASKRAQRSHMDLRPQLRNGEYICPFAGALRSDSHKVCDRIWPKDTEFLEEKFLRHRRDAHVEYNESNPGSHLSKPKQKHGTWQCAFFGQAREDTKKLCTAEWPADEDDVLKKFNKHKAISHASHVDPKVRERDEMKKKFAEETAKRDELKKRIKLYAEKEKDNVGEMPLDDLVRLGKPGKRQALGTLPRVADAFYPISPRSPLLYQLYWCLYGEVCKPRSELKSRILSWDGLPANVTFKKACIFYSRVFNEMVRWKLDTIIELGRLLGIQTRTESRKRLDNGKQTHTEDRAVSKIDDAEGLYQAVALFLMVPRPSKQFVSRSLLTIYEIEKINTL